uniref:Cytochrome p450 n=1 Tax=Epiphyas postvittana TaxID=65032 RepID=A0A0K8TVP0_EPIPO
MPIMSCPASLLVLIAATLAVLVIWLRWRRRNRRLLELAAMLPGPPALPVLGNALLFTASPSEQLKRLEEIMHKYGQYVKFWMGSDLNILVGNPEDIKLIFSSNKVQDKGPVYENLKEILGPGLFTGGSVWRSHRKIATPSYNKQSVCQYEQVFNMEAAFLVQTLSSKDPKQTFDIYWNAVHCTTQCVCQTLMGLSKLESQNLKYLDEVVKNTQRFYSAMFGKITKWYLKIPPVYWLSGTKRTIDYGAKVCHNLSDEIIEKRRKALARTDGADHRYLSIVDNFLLSGDFSEEEIRQETFTAFTTSQEASAKILSAVFVFLAHLPEWQDKVYNEILEHLGPEDDFITESHLKQLHSLDMVYKEVLRYMSIGPLIQRTVQQEITIDSGRITLPVGMSVVIPIHILHRDPQYWDEPNKVKPERFLPENVKTRNPNAFVPFSSGAMDCLGRVFGTRLIKTVVVRVLRHLRLEADGRLEDLDIQIAISVRFANGYNLRVAPRTHK